MRENAVKVILRVIEEVFCGYFIVLCKRNKIVLFVAGVLLCVLATSPLASRGFAPRGNFKKIGAAPVSISKFSGEKIAAAPVSISKFSRKRTNKYIP